MKYVKRTSRSQKFEPVGAIASKKGQFFKIVERAKRERDV